MRNIVYILVLLTLSFSACNGQEEKMTDNGETVTLPIDDSLIYKSVSYYSDGTKEDERSFDDQGRLHGEYLSWYTNGLRATEWSYYHGKKHGKQLFWWQNGQIADEEYFLDGELHGMSTAWSASGDIMSIDYYERGQLIPEKSSRAPYQPNLTILKAVTDLGIDSLTAVMLMKDNLSAAIVKTDSGAQVVLDEEIDAKLRALTVQTDSIIQKFLEADSLKGIYESRPSPEFKP